MLREVRMPDLGTAASQVTLVSWLKDEGDPVQRGEALCVVETDKAASELESVAEGFLLRKMVDEGAVVEVGQTIAYIGREGESWEQFAEVSAEEAIGPPDEDSALPAAAGDNKPVVKASPMIVNLARRSGVDLTRVSGTGPGGQITRADVLRSREGLSAPPRRPLSKNQDAVARALAISWREAVPISLGARVRMDRVIALREQKGGDRRLAVDVFFVHAAARAIREFPTFQCYFEHDAMVMTGAINVAVAVSCGNGLFLPVIKDADRKSLDEIGQQLSDFADKASTGRLSDDEMSGATFAVSNLGMLPIDFFTAIIPPKQAAILTIGAIQEVMTFSCHHEPRLDRTAQVVLTVDHRFINGREAGQLLARIKEVMETL